MMPGMDGWKACKEIRKVSFSPILMLTARSDVKDKVHGLEIGADDYLIKPFESEELIARVHALIRRSVLNKEKKEDENIINYGDGYLQIDQEAHAVSLGGEVLDLTPKEYKILHTIALNPKRVFTREVLLDILWGQDDFRDTRTIDTHIKNIRLKIKDIGSGYNPIQTVWGIGYKFQDVDQSI
ncbi:response regulator transcription factor, partial [Bacillus sp. JJ353]